MQAHAAHADRVAYAVLVVDRVLPRQGVQNHPVRVHRNGACALEHAVQILARHFAAADRAHAVRHVALDVAAGHAFAVLYPLRYAEIEQMVAIRSPERVESLEEVLAELTTYPVGTSLLLTGTIVVGRDIAHAKDGDAIGIDFTHHGRNLRGAEIESDDDLTGS